MLDLGVYRYLCTRVRYVIHGRVPGSRVQWGFTLYLNFHFRIKVALWFFLFISCICRLGRRMCHHSVHAWSLLWRKSDKWRSKKWNSDILWWFQLICWSCSNKLVVFDAIRVSIVISWSQNCIKMQSSYLLILYLSIPTSEFLPRSVYHRAGIRVPG